ncbi:MAG: peptide ABC transporter substrate-binding protein [Clostridia bacterium]|nr:peptide ABC transporter substrate-binding protein [Clostridia bacterium]
MKRIIAIVLSCCLLIGLLAACTVTTESEFVVNACIASEPETIDPSIISSVDGSTYTQHQFEGLMKYKFLTSQVADDPNVVGTEMTYGQALSHTVSEDGLTYTFTLRDDIKWSDGQPVKAEDFVYSWKRIVDPATASEYGYILDGIVENAAAIQAEEKDPDTLGIRAIDDKTVEIKLEAPCAYFLELCGFASLMPLRKDVIEKYGDTWTNPENIVVNGPFKVTEWKHDSYILMRPNKEYYDVDNLGPDAIKWWLSDSETAIIASYESGDYQFVDSFPTDKIDSLKASGDCFVNPYIGTYYLYLNCEKIPDWRVRAAMTLAVDRDSLVKNVTKGGQVPATGLVAQGITDSKGNDFSLGVSELGALYNELSKLYPDADLTTYSGKVALAKQLLAEAEADGFDKTQTIVYNFNTNDTHKAIAEACGEDWKNVLGISIELANQDWNVYTDGLAEHKFGVARLGWIADYNDALTYLELVSTGNPYNYGVWSNGEFDAAIVDAKKLAAGEDRDAKLYAAEEIMFGEGGFPLCPLYFYTQVYCLKGLSNVGFTSLGYFFFQYAKEK